MPDGSIRFDPSGRANGRGAYVCRDEVCVTGATGRGGLGRALEATVPADLADQLMTAVRGGDTNGPQ
jgi:Predicted nucleic-acid-binding protein implicated in transcription termination